MARIDEIQERWAEVLLAAARRVLPEATWEIVHEDRPVMCGDVVDSVQPLWVQGTHFAWRSPFAMWTPGPGVADQDGCEAIAEMVVVEALRSQGADPATGALTT